jgi:hypothetical protein
MAREWAYGLNYRSHRERAARLPRRLKTAGSQALLRLAWAKLQPEVSYDAPTSAGSILYVAGLAIRTGAAEGCA